MIRNTLFAFAAGMLAFTGSAALAAWPEKPITMIVAYGAKGATDVTARMLAPYIEKHLGGGARIEVSNMAGAGGEIGFAAIADAAPDGHTIGFINTPNVLTIPIERSARYTPDKLDPLVNIVDDPGVMTVHAESPFKTLADLVAHAKANPNTVTVGSTGVGSDDHLAMLGVQQLTGAKFTHVPFAGGAPVHAAMIKKNIVVAGQNLGDALRGLSNGDPIRILGVMSTERWEAAKDVPTFKEQGYAVTMASMRGIAAPKGLPADIRAKLVDAVTKAVNDPEFVAKAKAPDTFQPLRVLGPDAFAAELKEAEADFRELWKAEPWLKSN